MKKIHKLIPLSNVLKVITLNNDDWVMRIPKGAKIYLQIHFAKTGVEDVADITILAKKHKELGKKKEIFYELRSQLFDFEIPANTDHHTLSLEVPYLKRSIVITYLGAHMHMRGKASRVYVKEEGKPDKLIYNSRYVFKNRRIYRFKNPVEVNKGSKVLIEIDYDNSKGNPAKVDYTKKVTKGEDAYSGEMMLMHLYYYLNDE